MYRLVFLTGPLKGRRLVIRQGQVVIGRDPECHVQVPDDEISRKHASIEPRDDGFHIRDIGAMNGIKVNDTLVRDIRLKNGDVFEVGRTKLEFQEIRQSEIDEIQQRSTGMQAVTLIAVALTVLVQLGVLVGLSFWRRDVLALPETAVQQPKEQERKQSKPVQTTQESDPLEAAQAKVRKFDEDRAIIAAMPPSELPDKSMVTDELDKLRADVAALRQQVEGLSPEAPETAVVSVPEQTTPTVEEEDPTISKAKSMLAEALAEIERSNLLQADRQLARIEILAPDFLPAYIERARLLERRGYIQKAAEQWSEVLKRSMGTPLYEQAAAERIRLARLEAAEARLPSRPASETRPAGRIRISSVDMEKFQQNDQFDEMRLLRITLKSREKNLDPADMRIEVTFFDELKDTREVIPTRAVAPGDPLRPDGETRGKQPHYVTAAYLVPKGFRAEEETNFGSSGKYHGYLVRLLYQGQLQDERARPKALLKRVEELQPIHMAP